MEFRKTWVLAMILIFIVSGCANSGNGNALNSQNESKDKEIITNEEKESREKLVLNWFVMAPNNAILPPGEEDFVKKFIDEKFNVDLRIEHMENSADRTTKMNLKISTGDIPDMFMANGVDTVKYNEDGVLKDIKKWINSDTMPNYFKWITEEQVKNFQLVNSFTRAPIPAPKEQAVSYYIRQDWLDNLNLKIPQTYEEMLDIVHAFRNNDPDDNGVKDTYGFTTYGGGTTISQDFPSFYNNGLIGRTIEDGALIDVTSDIRMGKVLDDIIKLLDMDVVDPDWFLQKEQDMFNKLVEGKAGIFRGRDPAIVYESNPNSIQARSKAITGNDKVNWQPFHPWAETGVRSAPNIASPLLFGVNTPEENMERSIEILDWLASEEGFLLTKFGLEGTHYTKQGNEITMNPEKFTSDILEKGNWLSIYGFLTPNEPNILGLASIDPRETDRDRQIKQILSTYKDISDIGTTVVPPEGVSLADIRKQINLFHVQIVFDEKSAMNWPKYRQELMDKYGAKKLFDYYAEQISAARGMNIIFKSEN